MKNNKTLSYGIQVLPFVFASGFLFSANTSYASERSDAIENIEHVVVTATKTEKTLLETPASVSRISKAQLDNQGFSVGSDELQKQPGVYFRRGSGDNDDFLVVNIRGIEGTHGHGVETFLGLIDGIPYVSGDEEVLISEIPYDAVETIEIVRGPMSALYGRGGIAGAINYRLKTPDEDSTKLRLTTGSDGFYKSNLLVSRELAEGHGILASFSYEESEGAREHNERKNTSALVRGINALSDTLLLDWNINYLDKSYESGSVIPMTATGERLDVFGGRDGFIGSRDGLGRDVELFMATAKLNYDITDNIAWSNTLHYRSIDNQYAYDFFDTRFFGVNESNSTYSVQGFDSESETKVSYFDSQLEWETDNNHLIVGVNHETVKLDETDYWSGQFGFTPECGFVFFAIQINYETGEVVNDGHSCYQNKMAFTEAETTNTFQSVYFQDEYTINNQWTVSLGGRYDEFERKSDMKLGPMLFAIPEVKESESNFSPKASLSYEFTPKQFMYLSYGEGFSTNFGPVWQWDPSSYKRDIAPSVLETTELGMKGLVNDNFYYEAAAFSLSQDNRKILTPNPDRESNPMAPGTLVLGGDKYEAVGLEVSVGGDITSSLRFHANYSYIDPEWSTFEIETQSGTLDYSGNAPVGVPEQMVSGDLMYDLGTDWKFVLGYQHYGDYYYTQDNSLKGGAYGLWNAAAEFSPSSLEQLVLNLSVNNLSDEEYYYLFGEREAATYATPGGGRQFKLSASIKF